MPTLICTLKIPWDPGRLAKNRTRGQHWSRLKFHEDEARELAAIYWNAAGQPSAAVPVVVNYIIYRERRLDDDGATAGLVPLRDALFNGRITKDDSPDWVRQGRVIQIIGPEHKHNEWTHVVVIHDERKEDVELERINAIDPTGDCYRNREAGPQPRQSRRHRHRGQ